MGLKEAEKDETGLINRAFHRDQDFWSIFPSRMGNQQDVPWVTQLVRP